jgi:U4/U6.U5 tri-snRNP component SNU23
MSGQRTGAYGGTTGNGDTHRKTYDRADYAQKAAERSRREAEEGKERYEAKLAGKKYYRRASTPPDARDIEARTKRLDVASKVGQTVLVAAGAAVGKRGKGAGFYCEACDLTYKDHLSFVEHENSTQHLRATGRSLEVRVATVEEVRQRLRWLKRKKFEETQEVVVDLDARLEVHRDREEKEREEKRRKRNEKRRKTPGGVGHQEIKIENDGIIGGVVV